jgi:hypothetical protein
MREDFPQNPSHNPFAYELQRLLEKRGVTFWSMHTQAGIHPERIRKLHQSLSQSSISTLNPEELRAVQGAFALNEEEMFGLKAALLVTAISQMLLNRISLDLVKRIAARLLPLMKDLLEEDGRQDRIMLDVEGYEAMQDKPSLDDLLTVCVNSIEQGILAHHLSETGIHLKERIRNAQLAYEAYLAGLTSLAALPLEARQTAEWQFWYQEAQHGLDVVSQVLARAKALLPIFFQ